MNDDEHNRKRIPSLPLSPQIKRIKGIRRNAWDGRAMMGEEKEEEDERSLGMEDEAAAIEIT